MRGNLLSDRLYKRVIATTKRSERQYRNTRDHRRRNVTRGGGGNDLIAVLNEPLYYATTTGASATVYTGSPGNEQPGDTITVYEWKLLPGDVVATGVAIDVALVNGKHYMRNAACSPMPYPRGSGA